MVATWLGGGAPGQVGQDLLDLCRDGLAQWDGSKDDRMQLDRLAAQVVKDLTPLWEIDSRSLDEGAKAAIVLAVGYAIASGRFDANTLIQHRLDVEHMAAFLAERYAQPTQGFSADEQVVYRRLLEETCRRIIYVADHVVGYRPLVDRRMLVTLDKVLYNTEQLIAGPVAADREFEQEYRVALPKQLNRFDTIGVAYAEDALGRQSLDLAYMSLRMLRDEQQDGYARKLDDGSVTELPGGKERGPRPEQLAVRTGTIQEILSQSPRLVIRGQPGSGKSTLLRWLAVRSSRRQLSQEFAGLASWDDCIPFYLRLRTFKQGDIPDPQEWPKVDITMLGIEVPTNWVHRVLRSGRALVLIDGVDEVSIQHRKSMLAKLQELLDYYPLARYVVTSRPAAIKNWPEWTDWVQTQGFLSATLLEMEQEQVFAFIDQWHHALLNGAVGLEEIAKVRQLSGQLKLMLRNRLPLRRLARNPLLCTMICALHRDRPNNMPQNRVKLYQDCVEMLLYKRDKDRSIGSMADYPPLTHTHEEVVLREYAYHLLLNNDSEESADEADEYFSGLLESVNMPGWTGPILRDYFVKRTGLLIEPAEDQIAFAHRTFQEYLAAKVIIKRNQIKMLVDKARNDQWRETIMLAVGIPEISEKQSEKLFRGLLKKAADLSKLRSQQELYLLAAACMESPIYLSAALREEVLTHATTVIPPHSDDEIALITKAGDPVVDLLKINTQVAEWEMAQCVSALAEIGSERALEAISEYAESTLYADSPSYELRRAIGAAFWSFDPLEYCQRVLANVGVLYLNNSQMRDVCLVHLVVMSILESLYLANTQVSDEGLVHLARLSNLQSLNLTGTQVSDAGLVHLARLSNLQSLNLNGTQVSDAGLVHLAGLSNLLWLDLNGTQVSDAGLVHLARLSNLHSLNVSDTQVSNENPVDLLTRIREGLTLIR